MPGKSWTTQELTSDWVPNPYRPRTLRLGLAAWTALVLAAGYGLFHERITTYREQTAVAAQQRLASVKDTLTISFRQLAALPRDLSHRSAIPNYLAAHAGTSVDAPPEVRQTLDRVISDFSLPFVLLVDRHGDLAASSRAAPMRHAASPNFAGREYFQQAVSQGAGVQFLLGRASLQPGIYFAQRVEHQGQPVGVAAVKQDSETLNRLLGEVDGTVVLLTDIRGVVVLSNLPQLVLQRLPDAPARPAAEWEQVYQREPEPLAWRTERLSLNGRALVSNRIGGIAHLTVSAPLGDLPFKAWVLAPLDDEAVIARGVGFGALAFWLGGSLLIWLSWRRLQSMEATLQARRELFELAQALPLTVFRYRQPAAGPPAFTFLGDGVERLLGVDPQALRRDPTLPWRLAQVEAPPVRPQEFALQRGDETAWVRADSSARLGPDGSTVYSGYWLDVSAEHQTQARFLAVFEHAATGYMFFDTKRGITQCNPATLRLFGARDTTQLIGRIPWFPGLSADFQADGADSRQSALASMREHTTSRVRVRQIEWRFRRFDGTEFDADVSIIALDWHGVPQFCAVINDVTARKQLGLAMEQARVAAEAASQTKSSFLANMSHELRTPMNAIIGMTHLALEDGLPEKQRDYIEKANGAARNLLQIVNDILDVSKIEAGQMELERIDFALERVVGDMADVLGLKADEKGLELLFSAATDLPQRLVGDPTRLRQVLVNLGGNAIKFTERGEVTVGMDIRGEDAESVEIHGWVKDTGVGLEPDQIERLFRPFTQGDASITRRYGGTGLGLVISQQLVERMGGTLWVESVPDQGSTFHFTARFGRSTPRAPTRAWLANELRGRRALIVDDNVAALNVLDRMLVDLGVEVDRASSGNEALALVDAAPRPYTWFLLDWKMPEMDGVECARAILERHPQSQPCILLVTAFARDDARRAGQGVPLAGVLNKPVTPSSLHDCLVQAQRVEAPVLPARLPNSLHDATTQARQRLAGARVLLVEDHPLNQELACELLRRAGMDVVVADDGRQALQRLATDGPFDGVLMDCQMPVMDGYSATRELRADPRWQRLPVIAMTASALTEDRERALASGMNAHITKPIHVDVMLRTMAEWIAPAAGGNTTAARMQAAATATAEVPATAAIDLAGGLARCMGNRELQRRLLGGFRDAEAGFSAEAQAALLGADWVRALRRAHDLKGLAGTIGAQTLQGAAQALHQSIGARDAARARTDLERVDAELKRVLAEIDGLMATG